MMRRRIYTHVASSLLALSGLAAATDSRAIDALVIEARAVNGAGIRLRDAQLRIDLDAQGGRPRTTLTVARAEPGAGLAPLRRLRIGCPDTLLDEPRIGCARARVTAAGSPIGRLAFDAALELRTDTGVARVSARRVALAGGRVDFAGSVGPQAWQARAELAGATPDGLRQWVAGFRELPPGFAVTGRVDGRVTLRGRDGLDAADLELSLRDVGYANAAGTFAGENLGLQLRGSACAAPGPGLALQAEFSSRTGQALAGPVLLDFQANPLRGELRATLDGAQLDILDLQLSQERLLSARGSARLALDQPPRVRTATLEVQRLELPAAYASFMQIGLAGTPLGALQTRGSLAARLEVRDDAPTQLSATLEDIDLVDSRGRLELTGLGGTVRWSSGGAGPPAASRLEWRRGSAYGLSGDGTSLDFALQGRDFRLLQPARIPVFDGAIGIREFALRAAGTDAMQLDFEGDIEPISMPRLAAAFGWPEFQGQLSGRVPRVEYRDRQLSFGGDLEARVFDGRIVGRNLRLQDPLGRWPRLFAEVTLENLDLSLVTDTFTIGSITGRLEGEVRQLELFAWSPVAFDATLRTPPGDRSAHRISARAIGNISNIGGGGGGVYGALQSGLFRLFDTYRYDRLGIRCRLENDVCLMSGIEPVGAGYYLLKGKGLPRIDIVGNVGRVNWPQLVSQILAQMDGEGELRIE